jgi:hypothetical protein
MTTGDDSYPASWTPRGAPQAASPAALIEPIMLAIESYISALTLEQFAEMVHRTRG